jgi:hypothetical protein
MEGFKANLKMAKNLPCYKKGGAVYKSRHSEKSEKSEDVSQDKKIVKKAFAMHDKQEHKGEHTDLSKLRKGGRAKKDCGTVRKYKAGGGVYGAKKTDADIKSIDKAKKFKPEMLCGGKSVKKYSGEDGSYVTKAVNAVKSVGNDLKDKILGTPEQNRIAQEQMDKQATDGSKPKKMNMGGSSGLKETDAEENPGLAKLPTDVRNKMGYKRTGGKVKKMMTGGTCS